MDKTKNRNYFTDFDYLTLYEFLWGSAIQSI